MSAILYYSSVVALTYFVTGVGRVGMRGIREGVGAFVACEIFVACKIKVKGSGQQ
jgi:hypothetical protein